MKNQLVDMVMLQLVDMMRRSQPVGMMMLQLVMRLLLAHMRMPHLLPLLKTLNQNQIRSGEYHVSHVYSYVDYKCRVILFSSSCSYVYA